jgi:hypothetical protein
MPGCTDTYIRVPNRREIPSQASLHRKRQQFIHFNLPFWNISVTNDEKYIDERFAE